MDPFMLIASAAALLDLYIVIIFVERSKTDIFFSSLPAPSGLTPPFLVWDILASVSAECFFPARRAAQHATLRRAILTFPILISVSSEWVLPNIGWFSRAPPCPQPPNGARGSLFRNRYFINSFIWVCFSFITSGDFSFGFLWMSLPLFNRRHFSFCFLWMFFT